MITNLCDSWFADQVIQRVLLYACYFFDVPGRTTELIHQGCQQYQYEPAPDALVGVYEGGPPEASFTLPDCLSYVMSVV